MQIPEERLSDERLKHCLQKIDSDPHDAFCNILNG